MATLDWDKWNQVWKTASNAGAKLADKLAAHRFLAPAVAAAKPGEQECFCGWTGPDHYEHLQGELADKPLVSEPAAPVKKAPAKKAVKKLPEAPTKEQ